MVVVGEPAAGQNFCILINKYKKIDKYTKIQFKFSLLKIYLFVDY